MGALLKFEHALYSETCIECGIVFAVPESYQARRRLDHRTFYCPSGHGQVYGEGEVERLQKALATEKQRTEMYRLEVRTEREAKAQVEAKLAKMQKRVANGICPCCQRSFVALARHMKTKHPEYQK